jgi:hypothetical protein
VLDTFDLHGMTRRLFCPRDPREKESDCKIGLFNELHYEYPVRTF